MRVIMLMFDSLNRHLLPPYNARTFVQAPNFERLAQRAVTFDTSYVGSLPCMPARRDFHTARPHFLHSDWGPLEPYDESVPEMLKKAGIHAHLTSDHYHYWEDGGATYHGRYSTWQFFRGQEGDPFLGQVARPEIPETLNSAKSLEGPKMQDWINRAHLAREHEHSQSRTLADGLDYIDRNEGEDNWFLQIECFDPHEPFFTHRQWKDRYETDYVGPLYDWPNYGKVSETEEQVQECRRNYGALMSKCDASLGDVMDAMDRHGMWDDTMLVVWTDHGFLLGEHDLWGKNLPPMYEELVHTPFFLWDPRQPESGGTRRQALVQPALDLGPTLLRAFGLEPTETMLGQDLTPVIERDAPVREDAIFGYAGRDVNYTDGRHVYMRGNVREDNSPCHQYTLMPTAMRGFRLPPGEQVDLAAPFSFTKGMPLLRFGRGRKGRQRSETEADHPLYDVREDPHQQQPLNDAELERRICGRLVELMRACDAPVEQYVRLGLEEYAGVDADAVHPAADESAATARA